MSHPEAWMMEFHSSKPTTIPHMGSHKAPRRGLENATCPAHVFPQGVAVFAAMHCPRTNPASLVGEVANKYCSFDDSKNARTINL